MLFDFKQISFDELWFTSTLLTRLHSCVNPIVYGIMNKLYRESYIKFLSPMMGRCCHHVSTEPTVTTRQAPMQPGCQGLSFPSLPRRNPGNEIGSMGTSREKHGDQRKSGCLPTRRKSHWLLGKAVSQWRHVGPGLGVLKKLIQGGSRNPYSFIYLKREKRTPFGWSLPV